MKVVFFLLGIAASALCLFFSKLSYDFYASSVVTHGEVIDFNVKENSDGDLSYTPVIGFESNQGHVVTFSAGSATQPYNLKEVVEVRYHVVNPYDAKINSIFSLWGGPIFLFFLSAGLLFLGLKYQRESERDRKIMSFLEQFDGKQ